MSSNSEIKVDLSYLNEVSSGNSEFIIEMIDIFMQQTPVYVQQLTEAIEKKDWTAIAQVAHKIKPTLAFMGIDSARDIMAQIENDARNQENYESIVFNFTQSGDVFDTIYEKLEDIKKELLAKGI